MGPWELREMGLWPCRAEWDSSLQELRSEKSFEAPDSKAAMENIGKGEESQHRRDSALWCRDKHGIPCRELLPGPAFGAEHLPGFVLSVVTIPFTLQSLERREPRTQSQRT